MVTVLKQSKQKIYSVIEFPVTDISCHGVECFCDAYYFSLSSSLYVHKVVLFDALKDLSRYLIQSKKIIKDQAVLSRSFSLSYSKSPCCTKLIFLLISKIENNV